MVTIIGFGLVFLAGLYFVLSLTLPRRRTGKARRFAAHTGQDVTQEVTPDRFGQHLLPNPLAQRLRRGAHIPDDHRLGVVLDRVVAIAIGGAGVVLLLTDTPVQAIIFGVAAPVIVVFVERRRAVAFERNFLLQLPNTLLLIGSAMHAGRNFVNALKATVPNLSEPMKSQMETLAGRIEALRVTEAQAFDMWAESLDYPQLRTAAAALNIGNQVGLETDVVFRSLSESIQASTTAEMETKAITGQIRSSSTLIMFVPICVVALIYLIDPTFVAPLFSSLAGWIILGIAATMNIGSFAISRNMLTKLTS